MLIYIEDPKNSTTRLELISKFSIIIGYKLSTQKAMVFLYTNSLREKLGKKFLHNSIPQNEILRSFNKRNICILKINSILKRKLKEISITVAHGWEEPAVKIAILPKL